MKRLQFIPILLFCSVLLHAQPEQKIIASRDRAIGFVPQYFFMSGLRTDFDFHLKKDKNYWLVFSPLLQMSNNSGVRDWDSLFGAGIEIQYRSYLNPKKYSPQGWYLSYGPLFQYTAITETRLHAEEITEDGNTYTVLRDGPFTTGIYKFGLTAQAGYLANAFNSLYVDFYAGAGIRLSFDDSERGGLHRTFNDWYGDYGYSGTLLTVGMRIGMVY